MLRDTNLNKGIDWITVLIYVVLVVFGWLSIYGASYDFDQSSILNFDHRAGKQFVWILTAFGLATVLMLIDYKIYNSIITNFIYIGAILLLIATIFLAPDIKGSRSWLVFGPVSFQPAELAKVATGLALARYYDSHSKHRTLKDYFFILVIIFIPFACIIMQKETGSALVFTAFVLVMYREGMSGVILLLGCLAIALFIITIRFSTIPIANATGSLGIILSMALLMLIQIIYVLAVGKDKKNALILLGTTLLVSAICLVIRRWVNINLNYVAIATVVASCIYWLVMELVNRVKKYRGLALVILASVVFSFGASYFFEKVLQPHQQIRIKIVLGMEDDLAGAGYNVNQSKIAIGSGGLFGKGFLNGTQTKLKYVPEQDTDFIFCTVGEEFGFIGSAFVLILYGLLLLRLVKIAERQRETFNRVYAYAVISIFFFHLLINIGMVIGIMPVIGIPLPFFSYGGSSLWSFTLLLFILLRLDASRIER